MQFRFRSALILALLASLLAALPALAGPPLELHIEVEDQIGASGETFYATGPAVGEGPVLVCKTGIVDDISVVARGSGGPYTILDVHKRFTCEDSSGTFDIQMMVRLDNSTLETTARWRASGGTGLYTSLRGRGSLVGTPIVPGVSILDVYDGRVQ